LRTPNPSGGRIFSKQAYYQSIARVFSTLFLSQVEAFFCDQICNNPHEWKNLIKNPEMATLIAKHRAHLPKTSHPVLGKRSIGHAAFKASAEAMEKR